MLFLLSLYRLSRWYPSIRPASWLSPPVAVQAAYILWYAHCPQFPVHYPTIVSHCQIFVLFLLQQSLIPCALSLLSFGLSPHILLTLYSELALGIINPRDRFIMRNIFPIQLHSGPEDSTLTPWVCDCCAPGLLLELLIGTYRHSRWGLRFWCWITRCPWTWHWCLAFELSGTRVGPGLVELQQGIPHLHFRLSYPFGPILLYGDITWNCTHRKHKAQVPSEDNNFWSLKPSPPSSIHIFYGYIYLVIPGTSPEIIQAVVHLGPSIFYLAKAYLPKIRSQYLSLLGGVLTSKHN